MGVLTSILPHVHKILLPVWQCGYLKLGLLLQVVFVAFILFLPETMSLWAV